MFWLNGKQVKDINFIPDNTKKLLCFDKTEEAEKILSRFQINTEYVSKHSATCFESHREFDYMMICMPEWEEKKECVEIYLTAHSIFFFSDEPFFADSFKGIQEGEEDDYLPEIILYRFLANLTSEDGFSLEQMEEQISDLEDDITSGCHEDYTHTIHQLRKDLLKLKHYYESLMALLEDIELNRNHLISDEQMRLFHFLTKRVFRLYQTVINLRDYVTQVREAYQAQMDIEMNRTMKLFTVITVIFLPLTLVAGWYGMNVEMPEFSYPYSYPVIIMFCLLIVIVSVYYFKKNKWF